MTVSLVLLVVGVALWFHSSLTMSFRGVVAGRLVMAAGVGGLIATALDKLIWTVL